MGVLVGQLPELFLGLVGQMWPGNGEGRIDGGGDEIGGRNKWDELLLPELCRQVFKAVTDGGSVGGWMLCFQFFQILQSLQIFRGGSRELVGLIEGIRRVDLIVDL